MPPELSWAEVVRNIGVPGAVILAVLWSVMKKWLVPGWVYAESKTNSDARYSDLKIESVFRLEELRKEKDYWRDAAMKSADTAQAAVKKVEVASK